MAVRHLVSDLNVRYRVLVLQSLDGGYGQSPFGAGMSPAYSPSVCVFMFSKWLLTFLLEFVVSLQGCDTP